jgi:hypothetical protein
MQSKHYAVFFTLATGVSLVLAFETGGDYFRQGLLMFAGYSFGGLFLCLIEKE